MSLALFEAEALDGDRQLALSCGFRLNLSKRRQKFSLTVAEANALCSIHNKRAGNDNKHMAVNRNTTYGNLHNCPDGKKQPEKKTTMFWRRG
eukprot:4207865-Amphidinium_carterae.1